MKISPLKVELLAYYGSDLDVVNAARVSFNKESSWEKNGKFGGTDQDLSEKDKKLIHYLAKHSHWSPFAHNSLRFRIKAPVFCARQLVKHQVGGVWNEVSRRYVDDEPEFYIPDVWHGKPDNAKQGASEVDATPTYQDMFSGYTPTDRAKMIAHRALSAYEDMLEAGIAPEEARMVLPLNTMTEWIWTGSLMFFARVCKQRLDLHAQNATREVAAMLAAAIPSKFSSSWEALMGQSTS